jgi:thiol:disulfide interchange protein DsbD
MGLGCVVVVMALNDYGFMGSAARSGGSGDVVQAPGTTIAWTSDAGQALDQAQTSTRPVMIDFWAEWCLECLTLDSAVYGDPRVIEAAKQLVPVKIDTSINFQTPAARIAEIEAAKRQYDIRGLPRIVFLRPDGTLMPELALTGLVSAETMLEHMQRAVVDSNACKATRAC